VHAKDPFSPRIAGNIAFPDAEVANGDDGLLMISHNSPRSALLHSLPTLKHF
jgi:hypothetical protein